MPEIDKEIDKLKNNIITIDSKMNNTRDKNHYQNLATEKDTIKSFIDIQRKVKAERQHAIDSVTARLYKLRNPPRDYSFIYDYMPYEVQSIIDAFYGAKKAIYGDTAAIGKSSGEHIDADDIAGKYTITEPISLLARAETESVLPSSILYRTEFPEAGMSNRYTPNYEMRVPDAPMDLVSLYNVRTRKLRTVKRKRGRIYGNNKNTMRTSIARRNKKYY